MLRGAGRWLAIVAWIVGASSCAPPEPVAPPNIVLLISDDHGFPDHGFMGSSRVRTPHLDRLAREGIVFTHGHSTASVCRPALLTLLTGLEPLQVRLWERHRRRAPERWGREGPRASRVLSLDTLPRLLAERGYASFQAGKHWEGPFAEAGFSERMVDTRVDFGEVMQWRGLVREGIEPVRDFVERHRDRPFFVWFAPLLPHLPHDAPPRYQRLYADVDRPTARYYAAISWLDDGIGELVEHVRALGLERRTLFVYVADNGWEPGREDPRDRSLGGPRGRLSLHELGFRTPVVLRWVGGIEPQRPRDELVSFTDVFATVLDYAGAPLPPQRIGHSLRPLVEGRAEWPRRDLVGWMSRLRAEHPGQGRQVSGTWWRDPRFHYIAPTGASAQLFDLERDPGETRDVSAAHPEVVAKARARIAAWTDALAPPPASLAAPAVAGAGR